MKMKSKNAEKDTIISQLEIKVNNKKEKIKGLKSQIADLNKENERNKLIIESF